MLDFNKPKLILNKKKIESIVKASSSQQASSLLLKYGNIILNEVKPKFPRNINRRYSNLTPMNQAYSVTNPKLKKKKIKDIGDVTGYTISVKPKKKQKYYNIMLSGNNTYNGKKQKLNYSNSLMEPKILFKTYLKYNVIVNSEFKNLVLKFAERTNNDN